MTATPLSLEDEQLLTWLKGSLPSWMFVAVDSEIWIAAAAALGRVFDLINDWFDATLIELSSGVWLEQHAADRGTSKRAGETEASLRARIRNPMDAVTKPAIQAAVTAQLATYGIGWTPNMLELRRDGAYLLTRTSPAGTGDSIAYADGVCTLVASGYTFSGHEIGRQITVVGTGIDDDGTFTISAVTGDHSIQYVNPYGVNYSSPFTWKIDANLDGRKDAYLSRGYRLHSSTCVMIVPNTVTDIQLSVLNEAVRLRKKAGAVMVIEREAGSPEELPGPSDHVEITL
jgi:hypothetical protein